jgi:hypothetical protein
VATVKANRIVDGKLNFIFTKASLLHKLSRHGEACFFVIIRKTAHFSVCNVMQEGTGTGQLFVCSKPLSKFGSVVGNQKDVVFTQPVGPICPGGVVHAIKSRYRLFKGLDSCHEVQYIKDELWFGMRLPHTHFPIPRVRKPPKAQDLGFLAPYRRASGAKKVSVGQGMRWIKLASAT